MIRRWPMRAVGWSLIGLAVVLLLGDLDHVPVWSLMVSLGALVAGGYLLSRGNSS